MEKQKQELFLVSPSFLCLPHFANLNALNCFLILGKQSPDVLHSGK